MSVLDRVPVGAINARARDIDMAAMLLALLALPFMALGWLARAVFVALAWAYSAVLVGWESGPAPRTPAKGG